MSSTEKEVPQEFYDVVDEFIGLANELGKDWPRWRISSTLMFAAARYNVYNWLTREIDLDQTLDEGVAYYREQYEEMFRDNVKELTPVYAKDDASSEDAAPTEITGDH